MTYREAIIDILRPGGVVTFIGLKEMCEKRGVKDNSTIHFGNELAWLLKDGTVRRIRLAEGVSAYESNYTL